jgi:hypothetical protein
MEKRMEPVSVSTKNGSIWIEQKYDSGDECCVVLHPSQIPALIEWLHEAVGELELEARAAFNSTGEAAMARR